MSKKHQPNEVIRSPLPIPSPLQQRDIDAEKVVIKRTVETKEQTDEQY